MLTVCRLTHSFATGSQIKYGRAPNIYYLSKEQVKLGLNVHVICLGNPGETTIDGIRVHYVKLPYSLNSLTSLMQIAQQNKIDIVHSEGTVGLSYSLFKKTSPRKTSLITQVPDTAIGDLVNCDQLPLTAYPKEAVSKRVQFVKTLMREKILWSLSDAIITPSRAIRNELTEYYGVPADKIHIIPNGVDANLFRPVNATALKKKLHLANRRVVLYVGHFGLRKGLRYLLDAVPKVVKKEPSAFFILIGGTPKWLGTDIYWSIMAEQVKSLGIGKYVWIVGALPHNMLPMYYSMADVFVFPTLYEGLAKAVLEAMACQRPVVASSTSGILDTITDGEEGILVPPRDSDELAEAMLSLLQDSEKARRMGIKGRKTVHKKFTWPTIAERTFNVYRTLS